MGATRSAKPAGNRETIEIRLLRVMAERVDAPLAVFHPKNGRVSFANNAFAALARGNRETLADADFFDCLGEHAEKQAREAVGSLLKGDTLTVAADLAVELPLCPARRFDARFHLLHPTPRRPLIGAILWETTEAHAAIQTYVEHCRFLESVVKGSVLGLAVTDMQGVIKLFSRGACQLLGYGCREVIGQKYFQDFYDGNSGTEVMTLLQSPEKGGVDVIDRYQTILIAKNRDRIPVLLTSHLLRDEKGRESGTVLFFQDTREVLEMKRRLEEIQMQLIHADKMASLGKLAAGVAHEINNPLGGILLFGGMMLEDMDFSDPKREDMDLIVQEARRCREIVNSLLDFAHQKKRYHEPVDVNAAVEQCMQLLGNKAIFHNIKLKTDLAEGLPLVTGNPSQIKQVLTNIITNAVDAMNDEGALTLTSLYDPPSGEVRLMIADTGPGIPVHFLSRIFEPFFTTKEPGKGTGLGLSLSYNIMKMHHGDIRVQCPPGGGTVFTVALPVEEECL